MKKAFKNIIILTIMYTLEILAPEKGILRLKCNNENIQWFTADEPYKSWLELHLQ